MSMPIQVTQCAIYHGPETSGIIRDIERLGSHICSSLKNSSETPLSIVSLQKNHPDLKQVEVNEIPNELKTKVENLAMPKLTLHNSEEGSWTIRKERIDWFIIDNHLDATKRKYFGIVSALQTWKPVEITTITTRTTIQITTNPDGSKTENVLSEVKEIKEGRNLEGKIKQNK